MLFPAPLIKTQALPSVTRLWPLIGSHYWAVDLFRCFTAKENIIRVCKGISLFPHDCNPEVMATQPQLHPPAMTLALDLTFNLMTLHTHANMYKFKKCPFLLKLKSFQSVSFTILPSGLSLLQQLSDLTQADNKVRLKWNQKQFVLVWAIIPFPISLCLSLLSPQLLFVSLAKS